MTSRREFVAAYRQQIDERDETEVAIHGALARTFARQQRKVQGRLRTIRRDLEGQRPSLRPDDTRPVGGRQPAVVPTLRAAEVFMDGFDDVVADEVGPVLGKHGDKVGAALIGAAAWSGNRLWRDRLDAQVTRMRYVGAQSLVVVESTLVDAAQAGDTFEAMAGRVGGMFDGLAGRSAGLIARVEAVAVYGSASLSAAQAQGIPVRKQWLTQEDERVRPSHVDAHGQIVELGEPFMVGEGTLEYPGDPDGPFEETSNCRCFLAYVGPDEEIRDVEESAE